MSRRRPRPSHSNHERWLVSYADFITLLFAFFVVLYASSQVDKRKVGRLAVAIQVAFQEMGVFQGAPAQAPLAPADPERIRETLSPEEMRQAAALARTVAPLPSQGAAAAKDDDLAALQTELEKSLAAEIGRREIAMRREPDGLVISLREIGFFESGSAQMKSASQPAFDRIAELLRERQCRVRIEGHTYNVPIHTSQFCSNWELSTARAIEVVRLLIVRDGYNPTRLSAAGYAEFHPIASNATEEGRTTNRRVDIVILGREASPTQIQMEQAQAQAQVVQTQNGAKPTLLRVQ